MIATGLALTLAAAIVPAAASASPVATSDGAYTALGRVFPDPLAGCQNFGQSPCSPNAQGNFPATQFIQFPEFEDALEYMNSKPEWNRFLEVWPLATGQFPGNNLPGGPEFSPSEEFKSAGIPRSDLNRQKSDLYVLRVTDESVPDAGKKRFALSLSIHGIERAGAEGGTRAMEDLVTAATTDKADDTIIPTDVDPDAPTFDDVLKKTIIYFTYPNPDGWRRGDLTEGNFFYQRYNGNGVDPNRDWPDIGYSFRGYSGQSEPETQAFSKFYDDVRQHGAFAAGDDLHGQVFADALSYTLLPHGRHSYAKDQRIREAAETIHAVSEGALSWSPIIQPNDAPPNGGLPCAPTVALGDACPLLYGQTWGTVYDTINYTTTGTLGDWFDSSKGLNADGIDNEMSYSHLDRNVVFDPHGEQLHVDGNKALIYAHLDQILKPPANTKFDAFGNKGYVANDRVTRDEQVLQDETGETPQAPISMGPKPQTDTQTIYGKDDGLEVQDGNGGMRVDVTMANLQGVAPSYQPNGNQVTLRVECRGCDDHFHAPGSEDPNEWVLVADDYNQQQLYQAAGLTAAVNRPDAIKADGTPTEWRLVIGGLHGATKAEIEFTRGPASADGNSGGDEAPRLHAYDVANTDFFSDLDQFSRPGEGFDRVTPRQVLSGEQSLDNLDTLVLADTALPGYTGQFGAPPSGQPPADIAIESQQPTAPAAHQPETDTELNQPRARVPGSFETVDFAIGPDQPVKSLTAQISLADPESGDFDLFLYKVNEDGSETFLDASTTSGSAEAITLATPKPSSYRLYIDNWSAVVDTHWTGTITFEPYPADVDGPTGDYSKAEKDAWTAKLRSFVEGGGNLVLTDGALKALPDLVPAIRRTDVAEQTVYVGQVSFSDGENDTTGDPLAQDVEQPGARFNGGMRRQTFEPTPLGFAIQNPSGADESNSPQYSVDREAWEDAGGRYVAGSANSATRSASAVTDRAAVGELELGQGRIRILGALLPQPSQEFDHPLGIEPYAVTYTGYILARNLFDWDAPGDRPGLGGGGGDGGGDEQTTPGNSGNNPHGGPPGGGPPDHANGPKRNSSKKAGKRKSCKRTKKGKRKAKGKRKGKRCKQRRKKKRRR